MYHTTGFTNDDIVELCAMVESAELEADVNHWPPILGLFNSMVVTLAYLRRNRAQAELGYHILVALARSGSDNLNRDRLFDSQQTRDKFSHSRGLSPPISLNRLDYGAADDHSVGKLAHLGKLFRCRNSKSQRDR